MTLVNVEKHRFRARRDEKGVEEKQRRVGRIRRFAERLQKITSQENDV